MKRELRLKISLIGVFAVGSFLIILGILIIPAAEDITFILHLYGIPIDSGIILLIGMISIIIGIIIVFLGLILIPRAAKKFVKERREEIEEKKEKEDYKDLNWLKHQHYDLGRTIQDIAADQNVSMITISKWIEKLKNTSQVSSKSYRY